MKKIAVVLSGCGYLDGSEITEAVSLLIALGEAGAEVTCFAPSIELTTVDHLSAKETSEKREVLKESARIARGKVLDLSTLQTQNFDGLAFPGGFGAAKNLSNWAAKGSACEVHPEVRRVITEFHSESKPIGAICIAPVLLAKVLGDKNITITIGNDPGTAAEVRKAGAQHEDCPVDDYITDREGKIVTTPAYMYDDAKPHEVFKGIFGLAHELVEWA